MKTIAIIGGNGQVGTEASLFLSLRPDIKVIPISRSEYGSIFLRHLGFECRHGSMSSPDDAKRLLEGVDLVADFSVPHGTPPQIRQTMATNIVHAIQNSDAKQYVYASSHSVYRHTAKQAYYRLYPRAKLFAERTARRLGREAGKEVYILQLGMVHGVIQGVSRGYLANLRDEEAVLPHIPSLVVFVFSVAEALANIANGKEQAGTYTLVSNPAWSWPEVHTYYCRKAGFTPRIRVEPVHRSSAARVILNGFEESTAPIRQGLFREREIMDDLLSTYMPGLAQRWRAKYYVQRARTELAAGDAFAWRPVEQDFDAPGPRMRSISDSRLTMQDAAQAVEALIQKALENRLSRVRAGVAS